MDFLVLLFLSFLIVVLFILCCFAIVLLVITLFSGLPFLPTGRKYVEKMLDAVELKEGERFVDLGSGDGRLVIAAARRGAVAVGYELNLFLVLFARWRIRVHGLQDRARIEWKSFWDADLTVVDVVSLFGITSVMPRLEKKLEKELRRNGRVVSYVFSFPSWTPVFSEEGVKVYKDIGTGGS